MTAISGIEAIGAANTLPAMDNTLVTKSMASSSTSFLDGIQQLNRQVVNAETALQSFAAGATMSTHELMIAMEQAKMTMQIAVEVRNRIVDAYQEITRMQV